MEKKSHLLIRIQIWVSLVGLGGIANSWAWEILPTTPPIPADNPMTPKKIELGKKLFFDPRLSKTEKVSCQSCHDVNHGGTDRLPVSTGINGLQGTRNAPTVYNSAFWTVQFWDGRASTLEEQAKGPMINPVEMGMNNHDAVLHRLSQIEGYRKEFKEVFNTETPTIDHVAKAIAAYERTLITPQSAYDRYLKGNKKALTSSAVRGMKLAQTIGCTTCHSGPHFNGPPTPGGFYMKFPLIAGSGYETQHELTKDLGRYEVTKNEADKNMWRVPSWRNVELTGPYFHNGKVQTLDEAVRVMGKTQLARDLKDNEVMDLVAFLKSLTGRLPKQTPPKLP